MNSFVKLKDVDLCYEIFGMENQQAIVLISGLGSQMIRWDDTFCQLLVDQGFRVIRFDNRDSGMSVIRSEKEFYFNGYFTSIKKDDVSYSLIDIAKDIIGLLDHLHIEKAHFVGRSMGGIIAQLLGSYFPERVLSLTIIMSTSLNPDLPPSDPEVMAMMMKTPVDPAIDKEGYINEKLLFAEKISGSQYPIDNVSEIQMIQEELSRSKTKNGIIRQLLAMGSFQYNPEILKKIKVPTLVIHGIEDLIFHPDCGRDIADSIPNSEIMLIEGMGHAIPVELYDLITKNIVGIIQ